MTFSIINRDQSVKAITFRFQFNTANLIGTSVQVGTLPGGSRIFSCRTLIITPFNAGGNNFLMAGTIASDTGNIAINAVLSGAAGTVVDHTLRALGADVAANRGVFIQYMPSGAAATAGDALFILEYLEPVSMTAL